METSFQVHRSHKESSEVTWIDRDELELWLSKPHFASVKKSAAKLRLNAHILKERDHAGTLSEKRYWILMQTRRRCICHHLPTKCPYWTELPTHDIARSKLAISHTMHFRLYRFAALMFTAQDNPYLSIPRWPQSLKFMMEITPHVTFLGNTVSFHCWD